MSILLSNTLMEMRIDLPHETYRFPRFDHSSKICSVKYQGISVSSSETANPRELEETGQGYFNEFGIHNLAGYEEAPMGSPVHKIGVGEIIKDQQDYHFFRSYRYTPYDMNNAQGNDFFRCSYSSRILAGHGHAYEKTVRLEAQGFLVEYCLKNTGDLPLSVNEYNHNFVAIDDQPMSPGYSLDLGYSLETNVPEKIVNTENAVFIQGSRLGFASTPETQFYLGNSAPAEGSAAGWKLIHEPSGIGISETGSFTSRQLCVWGWRHVISPEVFIDIELNPGEETRWWRRWAYTRD